MNQFNANGVMMLVTIDEEEENNKRQMTRRAGHKFLRTSGSHGLDKVQVQVTLGNNAGRACQTHICTS